MKKVLALCAILLSFTAFAQTRQVTGKVTDSTGTGLSSVTVAINGTTKVVLTDNQGNFTVDVPANGTTELVFSSVGFKSQTVTTDGTSPLSVQLSAGGSFLDEVVVIGYGTVRKRDLTGSVVSVKGEEVKKIAASNVMESLQGKISGVDIVRTSGAAGEKATVTVRGNRSINADNGPLYIVDGILYENYQDLNANDIQSVEVLKDASTTAIYGSRGANGVILITTKKGVSGKVRVSANAYYGISEVAGYPLPMTAHQFAELKRQAARTNGTTPTDIPAVIDVSTYWPGLLLNKGSQQEYGAGVAGGSEKTKVYFSFNYFRENGVLNNDYLGRYALRLNIDQTIAPRFKIGLQSQVTYYDQNARADNILTVANKVIPYYTPYNADGSLPKFPGNGNQVNPLLEELPGAYINKTNTTRILSAAYAEWKPVEGLNIRSNLGIINSNARNGYFEDANTITRALSSGSLSRVSTGTETSLTWENIVTYQKAWNDHNIELTGITSYFSRRNDSAKTSGTGQLLPAQAFYALQNNPANLNIFSRYIASNLVSGAFRINYGFRGKYLLSATGRADGASQLAPKNRWSFFPSAAAAWRVIDENFMKNQGLFTDLKLRVSYGVAGNSSVPPYGTQSSLLLIPFSWNDISALAFGLDPQTGNPDLNWELTTTKNIGLDFSVLKNRIIASVDVYDSKTKDLLLLRQLPATSGVSKVLQNIGKTRNTGFELSLRTSNIQSRDFSWTTGFMYTRNKEKIEELVGSQNDILNLWFIGYPVRAFYDYEKTGIWQTADSAAARSFGYKPGDIRVRDIDGDKKITATNDRIVVGSAVPSYSFGINNDFKFKNFDLNVYVFARIGHMFVSDYANKFEPNAIENGANVNYWTPENPTNDYPRPNSNISRAALPFATTLGYKDGSFVKIRNITMGYTFPAALTKRAHVGSLRWYVSLKNYFTFSKIKDYDPEGSGSFERPLTRLITTGLNIEL